MLTWLIGNLTLILRMDSGARQGGRPFVILGRGDRRRKATRFSKRVKKASLDIVVLVLLLLAFVIVARIVGGGTSMLPWNW
jgi:hypothetical protein